MDSLLELLFQHKISLLFSNELLQEIAVTIQKPKLKRHFGMNALEEMLTAFEPYIEIIEVNTLVEVCRDPKDNFLLALAKDGKADFLITGDADLLVLKKYASTKIITYTDFIMGDYIL